MYKQTYFTLQLMQKDQIPNESWIIIDEVSDVSFAIHIQIELLLPSAMINWNQNFSFLSPHRHWRFICLGVDWARRIFSASLNLFFFWRFDDGFSVCLLLPFSTALVATKKKIEVIWDDEGKKCFRMIHHHRESWKIIEREFAWLSTENLAFFENVSFEVSRCRVNEWVRRGEVGEKNIEIEFISTSVEA